MNSLCGKCSHINKELFLFPDHVGQEQNIDEVGGMLLYRPSKQRQLDKDCVCFY